MIQENILKLTDYGLATGLIAPEDQQYTINRLLELRQADQVIDAASMAVYPGLINTHHHLYQLFSRNLPEVQNMELFHWLVTLYDVWKGLDEEVVARSSLAGMGELLKTGCTTVFDHHYVFPKDAGDLIGAQAQAAELLGSLLKLQEEPVMLLALLGKELRRLYTARVALDTGRDKFWLMEQWNIRFESIARQMLENARRVDEQWCANAVRRCYEVDVRMKSVSGVNGADELKLLLMELAQGA